MIRPQPPIKQACADTEWQNIDLLVELLGSVKKLTGAAGIDYQSFTGMRRARRPVPQAKLRSIEEAFGLPASWIGTPQNDSARGMLLSLPAVRRLLPDDESAAVQDRRRANLKMLMGPQRGARAELCKRLEWVMPDLSKLMTERFLRRKARRIEDGVGLPAGWLDRPHPDESNLPMDFSGRLERLRTLAGSAAQGPRADAPGSGSARRRAPAARELIRTLTCMADAGELPEEDAQALLDALAAIRARGAPG